MLIDPRGTFLSPVHWMLTEEGLRDSGLDPTVAADALAASWKVDFYDGSQNPAQAAWHAMAYDGESPQQAAQNYSSWVLQNISMCTGMNLGVAIHAVQESAAGGHRNFHLDDGSFGLRPNDNGPSHLWQDLFPSAGEWQEARFKTSMVIEMFKEKCGCGKK